MRSALREQLARSAAAAKDAALRQVAVDRLKDRQRAPDLQRHHLVGGSYMWKGHERH
jgi:hypothetical protein